MQLHTVFLWANLKPCVEIEWEIKHEVNRFEKLTNFRSIYVKKSYVFKIIAV